MITATAAALPHLRRVLGSYSALFFGAKGGGCAGFKYRLEPTSREPAALDERVDLDGVPVLVCGKSGWLVVGTEIDWTEDTMGARFTFTNPNSSGGCGCGATFSA
jgi:iron-sulfur cluster assembly accessory protein